MIFFTLFIAFLLVQGTFSEVSPKDHDDSSGVKSHDSPTHSRHRHSKPTHHVTREHRRGSGDRHKTKKDSAGSKGNSTAEVTNSTSADETNSTSVTGSSNTTIAVGLSNTTSPIGSSNTTNTTDASLSSASGNTTSTDTAENTTSASVGNVLATNSEATSSGFGLNTSNMKRGNVYIGFLPDDGDAGGQRQTMASINSAMGQNAAAYGWYAQATSGTTFDGSQLLAVISDVKACNCVFQPAVMPVKGWQGLTSSDNSQAVAIAKVMKQFTDQGIPVWLRFAHEMNYYQTDGTYDGTASDFKAGWAAVAAACKDIAPDVKMWWTPNVASAENYAEYAPDDMSTVDLVGIDYYPKSLSTGKEFVDTMKAFHDQYAVDGRMFAIGETGLGYAGSQDDRFSWFSQMTTASAELNNFIAASWFNYHKDYDYEIVSFVTPSLTSAFKSLLGL